GSHASSYSLLPSPRSSWDQGQSILVRETGYIISLGRASECRDYKWPRAAVGVLGQPRLHRRWRPKGQARISLFEPSNEANNERGECGENVGEQLLLPQPPPCRLLFLFLPDRMGLPLSDFPYASPFELTARVAPLSPSCHLARHRICSVCQRAGKPLRVKVAVDAALTL